MDELLFYIIICRSYTLLKIVQFLALPVIIIIIVNERFIVRLLLGKIRT